MADLIANKYQQGKDAGEETDIIVGIDGQEEGHGVQDKFPFLQKGQGSGYYQGQQRKGIQPHDIPLVAQRPGTHTVEPAKEDNGQIFLTKDLPQENGKEQSGKAQLQGHQQAKIPLHPAFGQQDADEIQGGGQVVGNEAQIIDAHADVPVVQQTIAAEQGFPEVFKEGIVLMPHVGIQHRLIAKRGISGHQHQKEHADARGGKGQGQIEPAVKRLHGIQPGTDCREIYRSLRNRFLVLAVVCQFKFFVHMLHLFVIIRMTILFYHGSLPG